MRFNLDTSAIITFVANTARRVPFVQYLVHHHDFLMCEAVHKEVKPIMKLGLEQEQERYYELEKRIVVVPDVNDETIQVSRRIQPVDRTFFATGEKLGFQGITADRKLVTALRHQGKNPRILIIPAHSLGKNRK